MRRSPCAWLLAGALSLAGAGMAAEAGYRDADLDPALAVGTRVAVKGRFADDGSLLADAIEVRADRDDDEELRGTIEAVEPATRGFRLLGFSVVAGEGTKFRREPDLPAAFEDLSEGLRVKVDGRRGPGGVFLAGKITIRANQSYRERRIVGAIERVPTATVGYAVLQVLGLSVVVNEATELEIEGERTRRAVRRRIGVLDDDDLQFTGRYRLAQRVAVAGELRVRSVLESNPDLDRSTTDRQSIPEIQALVGLAADLGWGFAYAEVAGEREFALANDERFGDQNSDLRVGEAYLELAPVRGMALAIGRQKFNEEREWYYNRQNLDAVRVLADLDPVQLDVSLSRDLFDKGSNRRDQDRTNVLFRAHYALGRDYDIEGYLLRRTDRTGLEDSPRYLGLRVLGDPGRHVDFWMDVVRQGGTRPCAVTGTDRLELRCGEELPSEADPQRIVVRRIRSHALDVGLTWRPRVSLDPSFTLGFAAGSGEDDSPAALSEEALAAADDRTFFQSGLHRNRGHWNGVVSFRYYGEVLDPGLSNLRILTVGAGLRPRRGFSADLVYHRYRQDRPSRRLHESDLDADPLGVDTDLGSEWDIILGYEPGKRLELRLTAGQFRPGRAFTHAPPGESPPPGLSAATVARLQVKLRF